MQLEVLKKLDPGVYPEHFAFLESVCLCGQADLVTILKILKKGKLSVDTNSFFYKEISSTSNSIIQYMRKMGFSKADILFSKIIFSNWFLREFGLKIYFQNFGNLIRYNLAWTNTVCGEVLRMIKRTVTGKEKYW